MECMECDLASLYRCLVYTVYCMYHMLRTVCQLINMVNRHWECLVLCCVCKNNIIINTVSMLTNWILYK